MIYTTPDRNRFFRIPDAADLPQGDFRIRSITGQEEVLVDADAAAEYELNRDEALRQLKEEFGHVLDATRKGVEGIVDRLRKATDASREERTAMLNDFAKRIEEEATDPERLNRVADAIETAATAISDRIRGAARPSGDAPSSNASSSDAPSSDASSTDASASDDPSTSDGGSEDDASRR